MRSPSFSPLSILGSVSLALALAAPAAHAQDQPPASAIRVTGEATVTSRPDRVELDLGVVTHAQTAQQAAAENARMLQNVLTSLRRALGANADLQTLSYSVQPDYQYPPQGGPPKITGYTATNIVRVRQDDPSNVGSLIDSATRSGANQIQSIRFMLKDESAAKANALRAAALEARTKANGLANALGLRVLRIRSVEEVGETPRPFFAMDLARSSTPTTRRRRHG